MTKEEIEKEAEKYADGIYHYKINVSDYGEDGIINYRYSDVKEAYLSGAEPREREIKSLGERCLQLQKDKGELIDRCRELEAQIEKMKCCYNCVNDTLEPPEVIGNGICEHCKNHNKWELGY